MESETDQADELETFGLVWIERSAGLTIESQEELDAAAEYLGEVNLRIQQAHDFTEPALAAARASVKAAEETRSQVLRQRELLQSPFKLAKELIQGAAAKYRQRIEDARRAAERRQAEERAQIERENAEAMRKADEEARAAAEAGKPAPAPFVRQPTPPPVRAPEPPPVRAEGMAFTTIYVAVVNDLPAFLRAVAETPALRGLVTVNDGALQGLARTSKGALAMPGVAVHEETRAVSRSTRDRR